MDILLNFLLFSVSVNLLLFLFAYIFQTDKITDISYSLTFIAIASYSFVQSEKTAVDFILFILILVWGIRLGSYLAYRIHQIGRDKRFDEIRKRFISFFFFWLMQGLTCFIVMIPIILSLHNPNKSFNLLLILGSCFAIIGWSIETVADIQKFRFKKSNPHAFMKKGLWSYVQHPNYTGELLFWWGIFIACLPYSPWYSMVSPIWISLIIIRFSGISILQQKWISQYGAEPEFKEYHEQTKKLIPFIY